MKNKMGLKKEEIIHITLITIISILFIGFVYKNNTLTGHDLAFHLANIKNIISNSLRVNLIMPNLGSNLGYGIYIFYPFFPHFIYAIFSYMLGLFNIEIVNSVLIMNMIISIVSSIIMYYLSLKISKNNKIAFLSSIIYLSFPYRLGTITVRMALNENFSGIFIPLILLGILYLFDEKINRKKFFIYFIIGYVGLIFSHLITAFYFSLILIIILMFNFKKFYNKERLIIFIKGILSVSLLVLPNIILLLEHKSQEYMVFIENYMTSYSLISENVLDLRDLLIPNIEYDWDVPFYIYLPVLAMLIPSVYKAVKDKKIDYMIMIFIIAILIIALTSNNLWRFLPYIFYNIQFPWRLLLILSIFISLLAPLAFGKSNNNKIFITLIILILLSTGILVVKLSNRIYKSDYTEINYYHGDGNLKEYFPVEYMSNKEYYEAKKGIDVVSGEADIEIIENNIGKNIMKFKIENANNVTIELPRIYYKGYKLIDEDNKSINFERDNLGLIDVTITEDGVYTLKYVGTLAYNIFRFLRIIFILLIIIINIKKSVLHNNKI